ncbi:MAG: hypothetical protein CL610_12565 [Anaerolineaceae bacterium]|nr:hypothetical protein [Anaerolineaceae bacterium]
MIRPPGRLWRIDHSGYILNDASIDALQSPFAALVQDAVVACTQQISDDIDSIYLTGSVARGMAVPGLSDLNVIVVLHAARDPDLVMRDWVPAAEETLLAAHPVVSEVQIDLWPYYSVFTDPACFSTPGFILKTHSICVWGVDLGSQLPDYKVSPGIANDDLARLEDELAVIHEGLAEPLAEHEVRLWCTHTARTILRAAFGLVQMQAGVHTRDVDLCCEYAIGGLPEHADDLQLALRYADQPVGDVTAVQQLVERVEGWLVDRANDWLDQYNPDRDPDLRVDDVEERE